MRRVEVLGRMSEYIVTCDDETASWIGNEADSMEPIVRCRDCRHYRKSMNGCAEFGDEWRDEFANVEPDGFCAWGERRVDDGRA